MKFAFSLGKHHVDFSRNPILGSMAIKLDGKNVTTSSATNLGTHFNLELERRFKFPVGSSEVTIEHKRSPFFGGLLPQIYRVFVDGELTEEHKGY